MVSIVRTEQGDESKFQQLLQAQIRSEFTASQQYIAGAVWFDRHDLPRLATLFYRQALGERNHAMMIVQYLMDNDLAPAIPGVEAIRGDFGDAREVIALALQQEREVTEEITTLAKTARAENDYLGEQFVQWFLSEQVEEVSTMSTLLTVVDRAQGNLFEIENYVAREFPSGGDGADPAAPRVAGGPV